MVKRINITLPSELIAQADSYCGKKFFNRSELIKNALVAYMELETIANKNPLEIVKNMMGGIPPTIVDLEKGKSEKKSVGNSNPDSMSDWK